jgi:hypothetical protein
VVKADDALFFTGIASTGFELPPTFCLWDIWPTPDVQVGVWHRRRAFSELMPPQYQAPINRIHWRRSRHRQVSRYLSIADLAALMGKAEYHRNHGVHGPSWAQCRRGHNPFPSGIEYRSHL